MDEIKEEPDGLYNEEQIEYFQDVATDSLTYPSFNVLNDILEDNKIESDELTSLNEPELNEVMYTNSELLQNIEVLGELSF